MRSTQHVLSLLVAASVSLSIPTMARAMEDDDVAPAPPSIGADVPLTYFGPAPSQVQKELIGPYQLLKSGQIDHNTSTITLPLYEGQMKDGSPVWFIVTDTSDKWNADQLGINHSPKLHYANVDGAARKATLSKGFTLVFDNGRVDFSPKRGLTPGDAPHHFPPKDFSPGSIGKDGYSPLVEVTNAGGHIYNAPVVAQGTSASDLEAMCEGPANHDIVHDKVVHICPSEGTVTMALTPGFSFARPVLYLSTEANHPLAATLEGATLTPALNSLQLGGDDSLFSPVERIFVMANGPTGTGNPQRQGLNSAIGDHASPLNVLGGIPTVATDYSPLWDINLGVWTDEAISKGYRSRMTEEFAILGMVEKGHITGPDGSDYGSIGMVVNCPIAFRFL
ncbi:MAG: hypothetical protein J4F41_02465 [Alphaproteobacteria bacterium]|nr:hypothetical protein [Alphaproteobacteria bacterium]